mmetsp:Transcript_28698/g.93220  ORF Transcript_28698/g.93220 Transcript_28698/m.93220 type:complete len:225 (-) Transcript_28698:810-1484(-)
MAATADSSMPDATAWYDTSITNTYTGGCGGRTMYSAGATISTSPRASSGRRSRSSRVPAASRRPKYAGGTSFAKPHTLQRQRWPPSRKATNGLMYVRQRRQRTTPAEPKDTTGSSDLPSASGASGRTRPPSSAPLCVARPELEGTWLKLSCMKRRLHWRGSSSVTAGIMGAAEPAEPDPMGAPPPPIMGMPGMPGAPGAPPAAAAPRGSNPPPPNAAGMAGPVA